MKTLLAWSAGKGKWFGVVEPGGKRMEGETLGSICKQVRIETICINHTRFLRPEERNGATKRARATVFLETKTGKPSEESTRLSWGKWLDYEKKCAEEMALSQKDTPKEQVLP